jgi:ribosomal protein S18 acetylase RimI-like enzyme
MGININISIRQMSHSDLSQVVVIHQVAFKGFFLERLGPAFLKKYYQFVIDYDGSFAYVAEDEVGNTNGFVVGFIKPNSFYEQLKQKKFKFFIPILKGLFARPSLIFEILKSVLRVSSNAKKTEYEYGHVELSSIAALKNNIGIGSFLMKEFINSCWEKDVKKITLTTNKENNEYAHNFYTKNGFKRIGSEIRGHRSLIKYAINKD